MQGCDCVAVNDQVGFETSFMGLAKQLAVYYYFLIYERFYVHF